MKRKVLTLFIFLISSFVFSQELEKIQTYKCGPYPRDKDLKMETYDYRVLDDYPVPPTLVDTFICDIWRCLKYELKKDTFPFALTTQDIQEVFEYYQNNNWDNVSGYRPWTDWNFVRSLSSEQKRNLKSEIIAYIKKNGVKEVKGTIY